MIRQPLHQHQLNTVANRREPQPNRDELVFRIQMCEGARRFDDMAALVKTLCMHHDNLTEEERNYLSCAYKNVVGSRRNSCKILSEILAAFGDAAPQVDDDDGQLAAKDSQSKDASDTFKRRVKLESRLVREFYSKIELELKEHCKDVIKLLDERLLPASSSVGITRIFYFKMRGDFARYLCETCTDAERKERANESLSAYKTASEKAIIELPPTHPIRLGLMLNFSVFYYEIIKSPERACRLAKQAFDDAIAELDTLPEERYRDATIIMQLLRDNLNLWESQVLQEVQ